MNDRPGDRQLSLSRPGHGGRHPTAQGPRWRPPANCARCTRSPRARPRRGRGRGRRDLLEPRRPRGSLGLTVALVEQPYRVAGRGSPAPAHQSTQPGSRRSTTSPGRWAARRGWSLVRRPCRVPHRGRGRGRRGPVPRVPARPPAATGPPARPEPAPRTRRRRAPDPRRPGGALPVRHPAGGAGPHGRRRARRPRCSGSDLETISDAVRTWLSTLLDAR